MRSLVRERANWVIDLSSLPMLRHLGASRSSGLGAGRDVNADGMEWRRYHE
jgi:hypothetical protein